MLPSGCIHLIEVYSAPPVCLSQTVKAKGQLGDILCFTNIQQVCSDVCVVPGPVLKTGTQTESVNVI